MINLVLFCLLLVVSTMYMSQNTTFWSGLAERVSCNVDIVVH